MVPVLTKTLTATVWTERANSPNKYFHINFPPLVSHVIHSYRCESINTNTSLTVMCFCFISQRIYCIINDSRCPLVNSPHFICLKHTAVLSNQKANQLLKGCYLTKYLSNSVIVFTTNLFFILSNMMKCGPRRPQVNYCDISNIQLRTKRTQPVVA